MYFPKIWDGSTAPPPPPPSGPAPGARGGVIDSASPGPRSGRRSAERVAMRANDEMGADRASTSRTNVVVVALFPFGSSSLHPTAWPWALSAFSVLGVSSGCQAVRTAAAATTTATIDVVAVEATRPSSSLSSSSSSSPSRRYQSEPGFPRRRESRIGWRRRASHPPLRAPLTDPLSLREIRGRLRRGRDRGGHRSRRRVEPFEPVLLHPSRFVPVRVPPIRLRPGIDLRPPLRLRAPRVSSVGFRFGWVRVFGRDAIASG